MHLRSFSDAPRTKQLKVKKKAKRSLEAESSSGIRDRLTDVMIRAIDAKPRIPSVLSEDEKKRRYIIGRNHVIGGWQRHNENAHDLACKIRMKKHAIKLLPKSSWLKDEAITIDMSESALPPIYRPIPVDTPPIPGFDPSEHMSKGS